MKTSHEDTLKSTVNDRALTNQDLENLLVHVTLWLCDKMKTANNTLNSFTQSNSQCVRIVFARDCIYALYFNICKIVNASMTDLLYYKCRTMETKC